MSDKHDPSNPARNRVPPPPANSAEEKEHARAVLESCQTEFPTLWPRIVRQLLLALNRHHVIEVHTIYEEARKEIRRLQRADAGEEGQTGAGGSSEAEDGPESNVGLAPVWGEAERQAIERRTLEYAEQYLAPREIGDLVLLARKHAQADTLEDIANLPGITFDLLMERVDQYCTLAGQRNLPMDAVGARVALVRRVVSESIEFLGVAKRFMTIRDLQPILNSTIGNRRVLGRIGGKAGGMVLAQAILRRAREKGVDLPETAIPESFFIRTDVFMDFMRINGLMGEYDQKYKPIEDVKAEFLGLRDVFTNSEMPGYVIQPLRAMLEKIGEHPLIVRSSSLLEDSFGSAFSGKYKSIFLGNRGPLEIRLRMLVGAIAEVYASTFGPDPVAYRKERNLLDYDEQMAVMVQKVVGTRRGNYYFPLFAGVAFARNELRWSPRIKKEDGMARIVFGLGTRAVDRVGADFVRLVPLGLPLVRPEGSVAAIRKYSQRFVDVINLTKNTFETLTKDDLLRSTRVDKIDQLVSVFHEGSLTPPVSTLVREEPEQLTFTFEKLLSTPFAGSLKTILGCLEDAYGCPVELEFAHDGTKLYILQCRPLAQRIEANRVHLPEGIPRKDVLFRAHRDVRSARITDVEMLVLVDPADYAKLPTMEARHRVARVVGQLNGMLEGRTFLILGPGRFGTRDLRLGLGTTYADICHTKMLVEIARETDGYVPEVSYGTHFFQDLVEAGILTLPVYPDEPRAEFNETWFARAPSCLTDLLPDAADCEEVVRVIDIPASTGGKYGQVAMDGETDEAVVYLG